MVNNQACCQVRTLWQVTGSALLCIRMRKSVHISITLLVILAMGCFGVPPANGAPEQVIASDPDDASELALLMRAMAAHVDSVKATIARGGELPPFPEDFAKLFTATPTEGMHIDPITYPTFGKDYLAKLDMLYEGTEEERPRLYNALVQGCANCHGTHCPGPLMRINKMYVPLE
jgi:hypothetical protein